MDILKQELIALQLENKRLLSSQAHLSKITNDYLMLYYLSTSVNETKTTKDLWTIYLKNITTDGFKYKNAFILTKEKSASFDTKLFIHHDKLAKQDISLDQFDSFISKALDLKESINSSENTTCAMPIINISDEVTAILIIESDTAISFEEIQLLQIYAKQTVTTIENIILNEKLITNQSLLGEKLDQFVMLHYISKDIHDSLKFYEVLEKYLISLTGALGFNFSNAAIYLIKDNIKKVTLKNNELNFEILDHFDNKLVSESILLKDHVMNNDGTELVIPLLTLNKNISALMQVSSDEYINFEKIQMLDIFAMQTNTMLENTYLNFNLEKEVKSRTLDLQKAYNELESLDKMKDEFLSMVSHELRTPITSIMAFLETILSSIEDGNLDSDTESQFLNIIFEDSKRLKLIVDDILDLSKLEANKMIFNYKILDLNEIISSVCQSFEMNAIKKDLILIKSLEQNIDKINLDKDKITKVLSNIISNAIKFSPNKKDINIFSYQNENLIGFSIKDCGIGIPKDEQHKVFSKFEQVENMSHHSEGTGLGMPISKMIVEKMNGKIWFESELGKGSTFYVEFNIK